MSGIQKLHLEDVWDDSPQNRSLINLFEKDAFMLRDYTSALHNCCQRVQNAQTELSAATRDLSDQLKTYQHIPFPLMNDNSVLKATLSQFTVYLDELSSIQQILAGQLTDSMMYPISRFLQADLEEISNMSAAHHAASADKEQAMTNYMKIQKKLLETDKQRQDADTDVFLARKKYHKTALHYSAALNGLQYKRSFSLIEPILGYIHAQKSFYEMGSEVLMVADVKEFLNNIHSSIQGVQEELSIETQSTVDRISVIEQNTAHLYHIEQQPNIPGPAADLGLAQKAGYLNVRSSKALFSSTWERCYFFTQGGNLMSQGKDEVAGSLTLDLNEPGTKVSVAESENRRFVFQVNSPSVKKVVLLQAESERERDEWMATIGNIICDGDLSAAIQQSVISSSQSTGHLAAQSPTQSSAPSAAITIPPSVRALIRDPTLSRSGPPPTPPPTPAEGGFIPNAPIQFDIITPSEESKPLPGSADGPPRRVNPFDATSQDSGDAGVFSEQFEVRFCGSMMVDNDRGSALVQETIRQIMAARALNNVFKMSESKLKVTEQYMQLLEPDTCTLRMDFDLADLSFWSVHPDNARLFAFICRSKGESEGIKTTFTCYVFECNKPAEEISQAISTATKLAFQSLMAKKSQDSQRQKEKEVLLQNIDQLDDRPSEPQFSDDGQYLMLETDEHTSQDDQAEALTTDQSQSEPANPNQSQHEEQATEQQATPPSNLDESEA